MKNKLYFSLFAGLLLLSSCQQTNAAKDKTIAVKQDNSHQLQHVNKPDTNTVNAQPFSNKIKIYYNQNQVILNLIPLLPDSSMASWEWKKKERLELLESVRSHNYYIDTTKDYNNISVITPHYFKTQVVDGVWCLALYKIQENNYVVITDDIAGDGNDLKAFELKNQQLTPLKLKDVLGDYLSNFLINNTNKTCKDSFEKGDYRFDYNFGHKNQLIVSSAYITKKENEQCLKGNSLTFVFNGKLKKFEPGKATWNNTY
ncbi:hypothetical protein TH53_08190 [Pedobacter lusitanus]|uniref:Lipoprotein n=1 Tax=Pedobacter lusitanus TaxID=1503925 RepID=A0A0D0F7I9_9SPHI|nr:hypothetical protein [Pedobacter lusitanus]KIO77618.1 hypothetical protein TH53_08190 [Pedobacter lusitanus]